MGKKYKIILSILQIIASILAAVVSAKYIVYGKIETIIIPLMAMILDLQMEF